MSHCSTISVALFHHHCFSVAALLFHHFRSTVPFHCSTITVTMFHHIFSTVLPLLFHCVTVIVALFPISVLLFHNLCSTVPSTLPIQRGVPFFTWYISVRGNKGNYMYWWWWWWSSSSSSSLCLLRICDNIFHLFRRWIFPCNDADNTINEATQEVQTQQTLFEKVLYSIKLI